MHELTRLRLRLLLVVSAVAAVGLAACGGDDASGDAALTGTFRGVTAESVKVGFVMVDFDAIKDYVDDDFGDQQATAQIFVDWINEHGGIGGRRVDPVYFTYNPIPGQEPSSLTLCTALTEDEEVFAVLGVFIDFTGDAQLCLTRDHETIHIGHELEQAWFDESPPGLLLTPDTPLESHTRNLLVLLGEEGTLDGRTVAVLADQEGQARVDDIILPGLQEIGLDQGSTAVLTITDADTSVAQGQLDSAIERWKGEGVDTVFMTGLTVPAKQFVERIKAELPDVLLVADSATVAEQAQDLQNAGADPNPYEGTLTITGQTDQERWDDKSDTFQECVDVYEEATGTTVPGPDELAPGPDGRTLQLFIPIENFCGELLMFQQIAEAAGPELTNASWEAAVADLGEITLPTTRFASICEGKYAANDASRIVVYNSSIGASGDLAPVTDVVDTSGGRCTG